MKCLSIAAVALLSTACASMPMAEGATPAPVVSALKNLYTSTAGAKWHTNTNWNTGDPCTGAWWGVHCDAGNVVGLDLWNNNLVGQLPQDIGSLGANMAHLELGDNHGLEGEVPESLSMLTGMVNLSLANAQFQSLPTGLHQLTKLEYFNISNNQIFATLNASWSDWTSIQYFYVDRNVFMGDMPASYSAWTKIKVFNAANNGLLRGELPDSWSAWSVATQIDVHNCWGLTGSLPASWGKGMPMLSEFRVNNTQLGGQLPESWAFMLGMKEFQATDCFFEGKIPAAWFANWTMLTMFDVYRNKLHGDLPDTFTSTSMVYFNVGGNALAGALPTTLVMGGPQPIGDSYVDFSHNFFYGELPGSWGSNFHTVSTLLLNNNPFLFYVYPTTYSSLPDDWPAKMISMKYLSIAETDLGGLIPASWTKNWANLETLVLQGDPVLRGKFDGALPSDWNIPTLRYLDMSHNNFQNAIPDALMAATTMPNLEYINLQNNNFSYVNMLTLPPKLWILALNNNILWCEITDMVPPATLEYFHAFDNRLFGALPPKLSMATALYDLRLQNNQFWGDVPTSWYHGNIALLYLFNNQLTGPVPVQYLYSKGLEAFLVGQNKFNGTLGKSLAPRLHFSKEPGINWYLHYFNVSTNNIEGPLPREWSGDTPYLINFDVSFNKISGDLPNYINTTASYLYLHNNALTGTLPGNWSMMKNTVEIDLGNNGLFGSLPEWSTNFTTLKHLGLSFNNFEGKLPKNWPDMLVDLEYLRFSGCQIEDKIPSSWGNFKKLTKFEAGMNKLYGPLPFSGAFQRPITKLNHLFLTSNYFSGTLPEGWGKNLPNLNFLNLAGNAYLHGPLPDSWADWGNLQVINVEANFGLNGTLPSSWGRTDSNLTAFSGAFCGFNGPFPDSWFKIPFLYGLNLQGLKFPIPNKKFEYLSYLSADYMHFEGGWPDKLLNSVFLQEVGMRRAGIRGELCGFNTSILHMLDLSENHWTGQLLPVYDEATKGLKYLTWDDMSYLNLTPISDDASPQLLAFDLERYFDRQHKLYQVGGFTYRNPTAYVPNFVTGLMPISFMPTQFYENTLVPTPAFSFLAEIQGFGMSDFKEKFLTPWIVLQYKVTISPFHPSDVFGPFPWGEWQTAEDVANGLLMLKNVQYMARFGVAYTLTVSFKITYYFYNKVQEFDVTSLPMYRDPCTPTTFAVNGTHECMSCPEGGVCNGFAKIKSTGNVWRPNDEYLPLVKCDPNLQGCAPAGASTTGCKTGYNGYMCSNCDETVGYYKASRGCGKCSEGASTAGKVIMFIVIGLFTVLLAFMAAPTADGLRPARRETAMALFKFIFNFLALMGLITYTTAAKRMAEVGWGTLDFEGFLSGATFFNQLYWACGFDTYNGYTQLKWAVCTFFILLALTLIPVIKNGLARPSHHGFYYYILAGLATTTHLCFNALVGTAFRMMDICEYRTYTNAAYLATGHVAYDLPGYQHQKDLQKTYGWLYSDESISCPEGASRATYFVDGFFVFFFLCAVVPGIMWAAHKTIASKVDEETATNVFYYYTLNYRTDTWYWEYVLFARKALIVAIVAFAPKYAQLTLLAALFGLNLYINERFRPFASDRLAAADGLTIACAFLTVSIMSFALSSEGNTTADAVFVLLVQLATFAGLGFLIFKYIKGDDTVSVGSKYGGLASGESIETGLNGAGASPTIGGSPGARRSAPGTDDNELRSVGHMGEEPRSSGYGAVQ